MQATAHEIGEDGIGFGAKKVGLLVGELCQIDREKRRVVAQRMEAERRIGVDVALADLEKATAGGQNRQTLLEKRTGEGIEHDIDAAPASLPQDIVGELERA